METVQACPECDSSKLTRRKRADPADRWRCKSCTTTFAEPTTRESRMNRGNISAAGQAFVEADPDDLDLLTDGGREESTVGTCHLAGCDRKATHSVNNLTERRRERLCEKHAEREKEWWGADVEVKPLAE